MAHGAHRIANFVCNARRKPAERRQLSLLDSLRHQACVPSRKIRVGPGDPSSGAKCGWISLAPSAATKLDGDAASPCSSCLQVDNEYNKRGDTSPTKAPSGLHDHRQESPLLIHL